MTYFTKEELEYLLETTSPDNSAIGGGWHHYPNISFELKDKLQAMIDNWCSHDGEIGKDYPAEKCMKCDACLGW